MAFQKEIALEKIKDLEALQQQRDESEDTLRPLIHLAPPVGWLNDPNGLCQLNGIHHIFFQYSPDNPKGGDKYWGHYESKDFIHYKYTGIILAPDHSSDRNGVYSGSAFVEDNTMYLYYTGNVKEAGDYDYIYEGRKADTILVNSKDGITASQKEVVLESASYPKNLSCHVRDPKVWFEDGSYKMVLGARTKDDKGTVLLYESQDKIHWTFSQYLETTESFGYMWECPDLFQLDGHRFLSCSPQGLESEEVRFQNIYQSGYFPVSSKMGVSSSTFVEWDMGFDFYAPQTYEDEKGRRILIAWMGVPDAEYDHDPSIEKGWQHMLSLPRQLRIDPLTNRICQWPVEELLDLRDDLPSTVTVSTEDNAIHWNGLSQSYELIINGFKSKDMSLSLDHDLALIYKAADKRLTLEFKDRGFGRSKRVINMAEELYEMRIFVDSCCLEIFINGGNYTMTTKYFYKKCADDGRTFSIRGAYNNLNVYNLKPFDFH